MTRLLRASGVTIVAATGAVPSPHDGYRLAIFALLAGNTAYYLVTGTVSKGMDAAAWLVLLALFALEAAWHGAPRTRGARIAVRGARLAAAAAVCAAGIGYFMDKDWLDVLNTGLWIAIVVLLEFEVRHPLAVERFRAWFTASALVLYTGLALLVLAWMWRGLWFDAYDALLWIIAFALIEMDLLRSPAADRAA